MYLKASNSNNFNSENILKPSKSTLLLSASKDQLQLNNNMNNLTYTTLHWNI